MAQSFKETAHLKTDQKAFEEGWDRIFGKKEDSPVKNNYAIGWFNEYIVLIDSDEEELKEGDKVKFQLVGQQLPLTVKEIVQAKPVDGGTLTRFIAL